MEGIFFVDMVGCELEMVHILECGKTNGCLIMLLSPHMQTTLLNSSNQLHNTDNRWSLNVLKEIFPTYVIEEII